MDFGSRIYVLDIPEKQMIFRLVPMFAVSTRFMLGRTSDRGDLISTAGGVIAMGAIVHRRDLPRG